MSTDSDEKARLIDSYVELQRDVKRMQEAVELCQLDIRLEREHHYRIRAAVDFHELYTFMMPGQLPPAGQIVGETHAVAASAASADGFLHAARAFLFGPSNPQGPAVLLPPYGAELTSFLLRLTRGLDAVSNMSRFRPSDIFGDTEGWLEAEAALRVLMRTDAAEPRTAAESRAASTLAEFIQRHLNEVLLVSSGLGVDALRTIRNLQSAPEGGLRDARDVWPALEPLLDSIIDQPASTWYDRFQKVRRFRPEPNFLDSKALEMVHALNRELAKSHELTVIATDAHAMWVVAGELPWHIDWLGEHRDAKLGEPPEQFRIPETGVPFPILRPITTYIVRLMCRRDAPEAEDEELSRMRESIADFVYHSQMLTVSSGTRDGDVLQGLDAKSVERASEAARKCAKLRDEFLNVRIAAQRSAFLTTILGSLELRAAEAEDQWKRAVTDLLKYLSGDTPLLDAEVRRRGETTNDELSRVVEKMGDTIMKIAPELPQRLLKALRASPAPFLRLRFKDPKTLKVITRLTAALAPDQPEKEALAAVGEITALAKRGDAHRNDRRLLRVILLHAMGRYRAAEGLARMARRQANEKEEIVECDFAIAVSLWRQERFLESKQWLDALLESTPAASQQARIANLKAVLAGGEWERHGRRADGQLFGETIKWLHVAAAAAKKDRDISMEATIVNNLVYYLSREGSVEYLEMAEKQLQELRRLIPEHLWPFGYRHTAITVQLGRAKSSRNEAKLGVCRKALETLDAELAASRGHRGLRKTVAEDLEGLRRVLRGHSGRQV